MFIENIYLITENSNNSFKSDIRETEHILRIKKSIIQRKALEVYI